MIKYYYPQDYTKICELSHILGVRDIARQNCGILNNKLVCFDYEYGHVNNDDLLKFI
jgi:hypothetical protein